MKKIKFLLSFALLFIFSLACIAQDSTGTSSVFGLPENVTLIAALLLGAYELVVRFYPTVKSYSVLTFIIRLIEMIFPDRIKK